MARRDYEYKRRGTANVSCAVEPKAGRHFTKVTATRASPDFAEFLLDIAAATTIHMALDNSQRIRKAVTEWFGKRDGRWLWKRFNLHHTPKHGIWLNQAEIEIGLFSRQSLGKRRIASIEQLPRGGGLEPEYQPKQNNHRMEIRTETRTEKAKVHNRAVAIPGASTRFRHSVVWPEFCGQTAAPRHDAAADDAFVSAGRASLLATRPVFARHSLDWEHSVERSAPQLHLVSD